MLDIATRAAAQTFAGKLRQSEPIVTFQQARARLEADHQAQELLARLSERQRVLALKQQADQITQSDIDELRAVQQEAEQHHVIRAYIRALQRAQLFLPAVNAELSNLLGFDFGGLARAAST